MAKLIKTFWLMVFLGISLLSLQAFLDAVPVQEYSDVLTSEPQNPGLLASLIHLYDALVDWNASVLSFLAVVITSINREAPVEARCLFGIFCQVVIVLSLFGFSMLIAGSKLWRRFFG